MSPRLAFAIEAAVKAGRSTLSHFQTGVEVVTKDDDTPVTVADRQAEQILRSEIEREFPGEAVLGEEEGQSGSGFSMWVLDPIDGTRSFVCGVPLYATLLSFEREGVPEIAVCYFPALKELLYAERGLGCTWNGRPCKVSTHNSLRGAAVSCSGLASMLQTGKINPLLRLAPELSVVRTWSDAYGHALVATGRVDAMIDPMVKRWDISAMSLIVREAAGRFTDLNGRERLCEEAVSSNGRIHEELLGRLAA
jgi:histidinol-phosphatase